MELGLRKIAHACYNHILKLAAGGNFTQYCKKEECWTSFRDAYVSLPDETVRGLTQTPKKLKAEVTGEQNTIPNPNQAVDPMIAEAPSQIHPWFGISRDPPNLGLRSAPESRFLFSEFVSVVGVELLC